MIKKLLQQAGTIGAGVAIMMVVLLPLWFLSGALFPRPDGWLGALMVMNPLTYAVDCFRAALDPGAGQESEPQEHDAGPAHAPRRRQGLDTAAVSGGPGGIGVSRISMRRFFARPCGVALLAIGRNGP